MLFYVPNNDEIDCFFEQLFIKDRKLFLKLTKNVNVARRNGATRASNVKDLTRNKAYTNSENAPWWK